jgi:hypothetical protein
MTRTLAVLLLLAAPAFADQVFLKNGGKLSGVIVERTKDAIVMEVAPGRVTLPMSRVDRVVEGTSGLALYRERVAGLSASDAAGWLALAQWAADQGLQTQAGEAFERVLATDPGNAPAHRALGHVQYGGRWMSREDSFRAQGLVEYEGRWMTPDERGSLARERVEAAAAESARAEAEARAREAEARAREAEADAKRAEAEASGTGDAGIPYPWVIGGGGCGIGCGSHPHTRPRRSADPSSQPTPAPATPRPRVKRDTARSTARSAPPPAAVRVSEPSTTQPVRRDAR